MEAEPTAANALTTSACLAALVVTTMLQCLPSKIGLMYLDEYQ